MVYRCVVVLSALLLGGCGKKDTPAPDPNATSASGAPAPEGSAHNWEHRHREHEGHHEDTPAPSAQ
jgi:hypothetical protein